MSQALQFTEQAPEKEKPWDTIGSGFTTKSGNGFNIIIGSKVRKDRNDPKSELIETVDKVTLVPEDRLYLGVATGRDGQPIVTKNGATLYRLKLQPRKEETNEEAGA